MPKIASAFTVQKRSKKNENFILTLNPACGLPADVCRNWQRRSFAFFPLELAVFRNPSCMTAARNSVEALIGFLKNQLQQGIFSASTDNVKTGQWLERFTALDDNPRAARIMGAGSPYSIGTIEMYREVYKKHIKDDPFCQLKMCEVEQTHCLAFMTRLGMKEKDKCRGGGPIAGTRTYEITLRFVRMAFKEYAETHEAWRNPFDRIKPPRSKTPRERDILETWEIKKLFEPGVIPNPLDRALAAAMFWAGMRRSEIYGLMPEDLNWRIPCIVIRNAWQNYGRKRKKLGDPKWHKTRRIAFPIQLQEAIHELWAAYGEHKFVFCNREGKLPGAKYMQRWLPKWIKAAEIDLSGRDIVPHGSRHSLASALEDSGASLRQIQDMLGHSDLKTTKRYLHDTANHINKMGGKIDDLSKPEEPKPTVLQFEKKEAAG